MNKPPSAIAWKRLFAEGGAIVASILLAFAIDAWWDERAERLEERQIIESLGRDFRGNHAAIARAITVHTTATERVTRLDRLGEDEIQALPRDSVEVLIGSLSVPHSFDPEMATIDALVAAGRLGLIRDPVLREALARFVNVVEDAEEDVAFMHGFATQVWEAALVHGGPWNVPSSLNRDGTPEFLSAPTAETLIQVRSDRRLMGLVRQTRFIAWVYVGELERMLEQVELIQTRLTARGG